MNELHPLDGVSAVPWTHSDRRDPLPDALPEASPDIAGGTPAPAAVDLLGRAARGAHHTIDRLAERAQPAAQQLDAGVAAAGDKLHAGADRVRHTRDEWAEGARTAVRGHPLLAVASAAALGAAIIALARAPARRRPGP
jgi:hypothetical protein